MTELQFYQWIATGVLGILVTIIAYLYKTMADEMKAKLSREEFKAYLDDASEARTQLRESIIKLFEKMEAHDKLDAVRFETVIKDFNGGIGRLAEKIGDTQINILTKLNDKMDRTK